MGDRALRKQADFLSGVYPGPSTEEVEASPFPGVVEIILEMASQHILAVVSSSQGEVIESDLEEFGLGQAISKVMSGETGLSKAERIAKLQADYSNVAEGTFMIGDTPDDIRAGKQAGIRAVAVAWV